MTTVATRYLTACSCICVALYYLHAPFVEADDVEPRDLKRQDNCPSSGQKWAFLGDSITAPGWLRANGFIFLISKTFKRQGKAVEMIPAGTGGNTSKDILSRLDEDVLKKKPDWLLLSCGLNNV